MHKFIYLYIYFISAADKIVSKGASYLDAEIARVTKMIGSANIAPSKKTFFMIRKNILSVFKQGGAVSSEEL